jgi:hypothetical protein
MGLFLFLAYLGLLVYLYKKNMLTATEIYREYAKCLQDPTYAIDNYLETFDKTQEGFVPFNLFPRQREIVYAYEKHRYNLITKPRQAGISTTTQAYMAIKAGFADPDNPEIILVIANKLKLSQKFLKGIKDYLKQLPRWIWGPEYYGSPENLKRSIFITDSKIEIELPNGSQVIAVATSEDALRGYTPTYLVFDEAAFIDNGDAVYTAAMSSISTGGKVILISTPNGMDPLYHKTYEQSKSGKNKYHIIEMRWYEDPRYNKDLRWIKKVKDGDDIIENEVEFNVESYSKRIDDDWKPTSTWYEDMCMALNNNARKIAQELDVSFLGSGGNVIEDETIAMHDKKNVREPKFIEGIEKEFWVWEEPIEGHKYIMGVDVSRGDGEDSSTIVIIDFTTMEQVMEYQGKVQPDILAQYVYDYGNMYNAYSVVDITGGMGVSTILKLIELNYSKKLLHHDKESVGKVLANQARLNVVRENDKIPGFNANGVRLPMISNMEQVLRENKVIIRSRRMVSEMKTFIYKNGRPDHMEGYHDDLLMALGMAMWVLEYSFKNLKKANAQNKAILNSWTTGGSQVNDIINKSYDGGFVAKSDKGKKTQPRPRFNPNTSKNMQDPMGDFMWLFSGTK